MMHIRYKLGTSPVHWIGLFADENIKKWSLVYTESPFLDVNITQEQFDLLSDWEKKRNYVVGFQNWGKMNLACRFWCFKIYKSFLSVYSNSKIGGDMSLSYCDSRYNDLRGDYSKLFGIWDGGWFDEKIMLFIIFIKVSFMI